MLKLQYVLSLLTGNSCQIISSSSFVFSFEQILIELIASSIFFEIEIH